MSNSNQQSPRQPGHSRAAQASNLPAPRVAPDSRALLARILDTPQLAQVIPQLPPELLQRVIQHCGLEDSSDLVALATADQLTRVFDLDLWRAAEPGLDEQFDAERFGVWLKVLLENGPAVAAQQLAGIDAELVMAGLTQHALVCDRVAVTSYQTLDGEQIDMRREDDDRLTADVGGYVLIARRTDAWDALVAVLQALGEQQPAYFHQVMRGCCALSNVGFEDDGLADLLADGEQAMLDLAVEREQRREAQGYVTPAQARAFLQQARELRLAGAAAPAANPLARAYFGSISESTTRDAHRPADSAGLLAAGADAPPATANSAEATAAVFELLSEAGILPPAPRALLSGASDDTARLSHLRTRLEFARDQNDSAYSARNEELAYLANVLMAGCALQTRPFTLQEASAAATAICNLGLENWPPHWLPANVTALPQAFLLEQDLVSVFQVGWKVLYERVGMYATKQLIEILGGLRCDDPEIQAGLRTLQRELTKHGQAGAPWHARDALDVLAILDTPAWAALLALIDECPTLHAIIGAARDARTLSVSESDFEFISENRQIATVHEFMRSLPATLGG